MSKKKNFYYVLVFTSSGPVYVTKVKNDTKYAIWDKEGTPLAMSKGCAEDLVFGLNCNFAPAVLVVSPYNIGFQPYNYEYFDFYFASRGDNFVQEVFEEEFC